MTATAHLPWPAAEPRASEKALSSLGALCFDLFLACQFLSLTRPFFVPHGGSAFEALATNAGMYSVFLLVPAVFGYGAYTGSVFGTLIPAARGWIVVMLILCVFLFFYGWLYMGNIHTAAAHDFAPYSVILAAAILGSNRRVWATSNRTVMILFFLALVVNAIGMTEITTAVSEFHADDRAGVATLAYRTQGALAFWPLLFLTATLRTKRAALLIFAGVFFVLAQQILFQKRAPTFRVTLFIVIFLFVLPRLARRNRALQAGDGSPSVWRGLRRLFTTIGLTAAAVALAAAPWLFEGQIQGLYRRITGQAYTGGAAGMLTYENERFYEAKMFMRVLDSSDYVIGRGFGGYFIPDDIEWGFWLPDVAEFGRRQLHVGGMMPFFKGGFVLALTYYFGVGLALVRGKRSLAEPFAAGCFFVVLLYLLFLTIEGSFIMSSSYDLVVAGLCMGHLLSSERSGGTSPIEQLRAIVQRSLR